MNTRLRVSVALAALVAAILMSSAPASAAAAKTPWVGMYVPGALNDMSAVATVESKIDAHVDVVEFFMNDSEGGFPASRCQTIVSHGSMPLITLGLNATANGGPAVITAGGEDAYLKSYAAAAKSFGHEVWLRPFHEMNGDWYPWSGTGPGTPADVAAAWRHVKTIFNDAGASNVKFVWCPNGESVPDTAANGIAEYWPGDAYVDYLGIDAYNAGTTRSWSRWQSIGEAMGPSYGIVTGLSTKPLLLGETSSVERGGDKAAWIADLFGSIRTKYTRIVGVVWFDAKQTYDWRLDSSSSAQTAFRSAVSTRAEAAETTLPTGPSLSIDSWSQGPTLGTAGGSYTLAGLRAGSTYWMRVLPTYEHRATSSAPSRVPR